METYCFNWRTLQDAREDGEFLQYAWQELKMACLQEELYGVNNRTDIDYYCDFIMQYAYNA